MRSRLTLSHVSLLALVLVASVAASCPPDQVDRARQVSVDVHAVLAAVDDAEHALYDTKLVPQWTEAHHRSFSEKMIVALHAGRALNTAVRQVPIPPTAKTDLTIVTEMLQQLTTLLEGTIPPDTPLARKLVQAKDAVLALLPLFLEED